MDRSADKDDRQARQSKSQRNGEPQAGRSGQGAGSERAPEGQGQRGKHTEHGKHAGHSVGMFRNKFWICLILSIPILFFSEEIQDWFGYSAPDFPGASWIAPGLGTLVFFYGGRVFLKGAWHELQQRQPGMMTLISLAIAVAFVYSVFVTLGFPGGALWWAAGYNIVAIPLAAGVLAWMGILLAPAAGAVLMSASTVIVAINAQLLRELPGRDTRPRFRRRCFKKG